MRTSNSTLISALACVLIILQASPTLAARVYLEDADSSKPATTNPNMPSLEQHRWPRVMMAETQTLTGNAEQYSKYQIIATQGGVINKVAELQQSYPDLMYFRMFNPYEYSGYNLEDEGETCPQGNGIPFNQTTAATESCGVYAGHWLYKAGTTTAAYVNRTATIVPVQDTSIFTVGEYVVVYDAPAGSFNNAEHMRVVGKNTANGTLTVERAYKSNSENHPNRSIIAPHVLGQSSVDDARNWVFNLSTQCPKDANNRRMITHLARWLEDNYNRDFRGDLTNINVSGILFDSDRPFLAPGAGGDTNNDLIQDNGLSNSGVNWYGQGLDKLYENVRQQFPNLVLSGGTRDSAGFPHLNGSQMEGFPNNSDFHTPNPVYDRLGSLLAKYRYQSRHKQTGPAHSHVLSKTPSKLYPFDASPAPTSNRAFRFALGMTMLEDGYFAFRNIPAYPDVWFDEYAVDVTPGSANYGKAIVSNPNNESQIRAHTGWLGKPTGVRQRIYDDNQFAPSLSLLQNGTFESNNDLDEWSGREITLSTTSVAEDVQDGSKALRASNHLSYQDLLFEASIRGPRADVIAGRQYTFVFSAKASTEREISATAGGHAERFLLAPEWQRFVVTFTAEETGSFRTNFNVGQQDTMVWVDSVYLFEGDANLFRRDFDNGIVIVNATPSSRTVALGGTYQRIDGAQDAVNNGASLTSVTIPAYDMALLVKPDPGGVADTQPPSITIDSPTLEATSPITDTTILIRDNVRIDAEDVVLRSNSTVDVADFNCAQTNTRRVDCSLIIIGSGDLKILAHDVANNAANSTRAGYQISGVDPGDDIQAPDIVITSPTKISSVTISDTTIAIEDNIGVLAAAVELRNASTAGVNNFNCTQISTTRVDCSLDITSSGDIQVLATDTSGNRRFKSAFDFQIVADSQPPTIQISSPTLVSDFTIRDTTISVQDNLGISANAVQLQSSSTSGVRSFNCSQNSATQVNCNLTVTSSGSVTVLATDLAGNQRFATANGFIVLRKGFPALPAILLLLDGN